MRFPDDPQSRLSHCPPSFCSHALQTPCTGMASCPECPPNPVTPTPCEGLLHKQSKETTGDLHRRLPHLPQGGREGSYNQLESSEVSAVKYKTSGPQISNTYVMLPGNHAPECARYVNKNYFGLTKISNLTTVRNSLLLLICLEHPTLSSNHLRTQNQHPSLMRLSFPALICVCIAPQLPLLGSYITTPLPPSPQCPKRH